MKNFKQTLCIIAFIVAVIIASVMAIVASDSPIALQSPITVRFAPSPGTFTDDESGIRTGLFGFRIDSFPEPVPPAGYVFIGWFANGTQLHPPIAAVRSITILAVYSPAPDPESAVRFAIVYDPGPGQLPPGTPPVQSLTYGSPLINLPVPTHTGYNFGGWIWNDEAVTIPFIVRSDMILEAVWIRDTGIQPPQPAAHPPAIPAFHHVVTFNPFPGAFAGDETGLRFGRNFSILRDMPEDPVRHGAIFDGWRLPDGSPLNDDPLVIRGDIMLTAIWVSVTDSNAASGVPVETRPNPQTSPIVVSVKIFGAVILLGLTTLAIMKLCTGQAAADGKYRAAMVRYVREIRILIKNR